MEFIEYTIPPVPELEYFTDYLDVYVNLDNAIKCFASDDYTEFFYIMHNYGMNLDGSVNYNDLISRYEWRIPKGAWDLREFNGQPYHAVFHMEGPWVQIQIEVGYTYPRSGGEITFYSKPYKILIDNRYQQISSPYINSITSNYLTSIFFDYSKKYFNVIIGDYTDLILDKNTIVMNSKGLFPKIVVDINEETDKPVFDLVSSDMQQLLRYIIRNENFKDCIRIQLNKLEETDTISNFEKLLFMLNYNYRKIPMYIQGDLTYFWEGS